MRRRTVTIPTAFQLLDTLVTTADSFVNVRDQQVARLNHNILLAKRVPNTLFTKNFTSVDDSGTGLLYTTIVVLKASHEFGSAILRCKILVPFYVKQLRLRLRACKSALDEQSELAEDPIVTAEVWNPSAKKVKKTLQSAVVSAANGVPTDYTIDINVPPVSDGSGLEGGRRVYEFGMWAQCFIDSTHSMAAAQSIVGVEQNTIIVANATGTARRVAYADTDLGIEVQRITKQNALGGGAYQMFMGKPFSRVPDCVADTLNIREVLGVDLYSASLRCLPVTDFDQEYAL
jgi:hypothetical protein